MSTTPTHPTPTRPLYIAGQQQAPPPPPPAPPLPPPPPPPLPSTKYVQRAATAFGRLAHPFFLGSRPSSAQGHREAGHGGRPEGMRPPSAVQRSSSPISSQSTTHKTGIPIAALDISPERTHAILAGRDILKTVRVGPTSCAEDFNLRSKLSAYASAHHASRDAIAAQHRDQLAAKDVKWSRGNFSTTIATAAANGRIVVYDINRPSIEIGRLHEHTRQVHKLAFNPHQGALLISGSQDGTVRMWDMRELRTDRAVWTGRSIRRFMGHSEGVRDLKWSPADGVEFATGTDAGTIQRWDFRKESAPILKLNAHDKTCMSLDWHPSGRYLASGSADKTIKVWDFRSTDRRMKPTWQLRAPQAVANIRWRPGSAAFGDDGRPSTYLASSYDARDPRIHVWDFRRPYVPFREIDRYDTPASDFLWHSEDVLWSVGVAGMFTQTDLNFVPQPLERMSVNVLATGPENLAFFSEFRSTKRMPLAEAEEQFLRGTDHHGSSGERLSGSHSANEGSFEEPSHASNTLKKRPPKFSTARLTSNNSSSSVGFGEDVKPTEPPSLDALYRSTQTAAVGQLPGVWDSKAFQFLAQAYALPEWTFAASDKEMLSSVRNLFERNATLASRTGQYRLAQTWRILGHALYTELLARADELHREASLKKKKAPTSAWVPTEGIAPSAKPTPPSEVSKALQGLPTHSESGSNVPTPLARPVREMPMIPPVDEQSLEHDFQADAVPIPAPAWQRRASVQLAMPLPSNRDGTSPGQPVNVSAADRAASSTSASGMPLPRSIADFSGLEQQMEAQRSAMNNYRARPRTLLRLDNPSDEGLGHSPVFPSLDRHDSNESFQMFSGSTDSDPRSVPIVGSFGDTPSVDASAANSLGSSVTQDFALSSQMRQSQLRHGQGASRSADQTDELASESTESPVFDDLSFSVESDALPSDARPAGEEQKPVQRPITMVSPEIHPARTTAEIEQSPPATMSSLLLAHPAPPILDPPPWTLSALLPPLLEYHLETLCDTQLPSLLALFLYPLCPALFAGSSPPPAYLLAYHELLISLRLFIPAAALRNAAASISLGDVVPFSSIDPATSIEQGSVVFPEIALATTVDQGRGTEADKMGLWCDECGRSVKGEQRGWCSRCCTAWAPCAVCELPVPPEARELGYVQSDTGTTLWAWCQGCGHGGHSRCLRAWWRSAPPSTSTFSTKGTSDTIASNMSSERPSSDLSDGACPVLGCTHACVAGPRRTVRLAALQQAASKRERGGSVARDSWIAGESRAVEVAMRSLGGAAGVTRSASAGAGTLAGNGGGSGAGVGVSTSAGAGLGMVPVAELTAHVGRPSSSVEEAVVIVDPELGAGEPRGKDGAGPPPTSRSLSGGARSLAGAGRSLSGTGRRVRLAVPRLGTTPPAASAAAVGLRERRESGA